MRKSWKTKCEVKNNNPALEGKQRYIVYIMLFFFLFILHFNMSLSRSDDALFREILNSKSLIEHIKTLYLYTNGKIFPDTMAAIFTFINPWIWKILNCCIFLVIALCINYVFLDNRKKYTWVGASIVLLLPFSLLTSAGYVATSTNYVWSTSALLIALIPIKFVWDFKQNKYMYILCLIGAIYAGNQEQTCAIMITVYTLYIMYSLYRKEKVHKYIWLMFIIAILGLIFVFTAPGHINRANLYTRFNMPDFLSLNLFQKLIRGFTSTSAYLLCGKNLIWPLFSFMLFLLIIVRKKNWLIRLIASIPVLCSIFFGVFQDYLLPQKLKELFCWFPEWGYNMWDFHYINAITYMDLKYYIPILFSILIIGIIILEIFWLFGVEKKGVVLFLTFSAGLCSRVIMGISPTLYGSSFRTFIFLYFALGIGVAIIFEELVSNHKKAAFIGKICICLTVICTYYASYMSIG